MFSTRHVRYLALILAVACGGRIDDRREPKVVYPVTALQTVDVLIDYRFTPEELIGVIEATERWNLAFNGNFGFRVVSDDYDFWPENLHNGDILVLRQPRCDPSQGGWVDDVPGHYVHMCPNMYSTIVMHELGHILGLIHLEDKTDSIMFPTIGRDACIDIPTIVQLYAIHPDWTELKEECP